MIFRIVTVVTAAALVFPLAGCARHQHGAAGRIGGGTSPGVLTPGSGWKATWIATPPSQGSSGDRGYDEMPSAKFDVIPYQVIKGDLPVCVIAGKGPTQAQYDAGVHNAIAKVSFSDDNGPWVDVTAPALNPATHVIEYCVTVRDADHADGAHEVRAIAYPLTGVPRVLQGEKMAQPAPSFTGHISGATLTVDSGPSAGVLQPGAYLSGVSIYFGTLVTAQTDATHYTINRDYGSSGVASEAMTGSYRRNDGAYGLIFVTNARGSVPIQTMYVAAPDDPTTPGADTDACGTQTAPCATMLQARQRLKAIVGGKTPEVGGSHIYFAPNTSGTPAYQWANPDSDNGLAARWAWVDVDRWPGRDGVVTLSGGMGKYGPRIEKVRLGDVTIISDPESAGGNDGIRPGTTTVEGRDTYLFCDGATFVGQGLQAPNDANFPFRNTRWPGDTFVRGCDISNYTNGPLGSAIIQGGHVHDILSDALTYSPMIVAAKVTDVVSGQSAHPDVAQYSGDLYQVEAYVNVQGDGVLHVTSITVGAVTDIAPGKAMFAEQQDNVALVGGYWITRQIPTQSGDIATYELNNKTLTLKAGGVFAGTITPGSGGADGTYGNVKMTTNNPNGEPPTAAITVSGGKVTAVTITTAAKHNAIGDVLSAAPSQIGGVTGFSYVVTQLTNFVMFTTPRWNVILDGLHVGRQWTATVGSNINAQCVYPNQNANFDFMFAYVQIDNSLNSGRTCVSANGYIENFFQLGNDFRGGPNHFKTDAFNFQYSGRNNTIVDSFCHDHPFNAPADGSVLGLAQAGAENCGEGLTARQLRRVRAVSTPHPKPMKVAGA
jgi:hypothetical protein